MKFGIISIYMAFISVAYSSWFYFQAYKSERKPVTKKRRPDNVHHLKRARMGFYFVTGWVTLASLYLWYLIFSHQFRVEYIYRYTSSTLGTGYLFSAFWAGQEGSFLFWAFMLALLGMVFLKYARHLEAPAMLTVNIVQAAFLLLLIKASPFALSGAVPTEGAGLNPLLQNPWMVIHPPLLFLGYAATTIPFAIVIAALVKHDFSEWIHIAFPWTLFASVVMGAGIIIGGFWSYKVLGWGGYWGWDPVENSSLIAWLTVLALFHGLLVSRFRGGLQKTSFSLAILSFFFVIYATFLTRSGVLADFSVHSFEDLGINGFLILYLLATLFFGFSLLFQRKNEIPGAPISFHALNKENILLLTVLVLATSVLFILVGTSSPLITKLFGPPSQIDSSFYNRVNLPIGILMSLFLGAAPMLVWKDEAFKIILSRLIISISVALVSAVAAFLYGGIDILTMLFIVTAIFALTSNLIVLIQKIRFGWRLLPAPLAHVGVALMFIGIIISGKFDANSRVILSQGISKNVLGYDLLYKGRFSGPDGKDGVHIDGHKGPSAFTADPRLYYNDYTRSEMREPWVKEDLLSDLYIAPLQIFDPSESGQDNTLSLKKGEEKQFAGYDVRFSTFDMSVPEQEKGVFRVAAVLQLTKDDQTFELRPAIVVKGGKQLDSPVFIPGDVQKGDRPQVSLRSIKPDEHQIVLAFMNIGHQQDTQKSVGKIALDVSRKPFMSILWIGTVLLTLGSVLAMLKRTMDLKISPQR